MHKIRRAAQFTKSDWRYLAIAILELLAARVLLAAVTARKILEGLRSPLPGPPRQEKADIDVARLSWAIAVAAQHVPWRSDCFIRAIAADRWLRRHHLQPDFYLGVIKDEKGGFAAHAWLQYGGITVTGGKYDQYSKLIEPQKLGAADTRYGLPPVHPNTY